MHGCCVQYVVKDKLSKAKFHFHSWQLEEIKNIIDLCQTSETCWLPSKSYWTWNCIFIHPKWCIYFHHALCPWQQNMSDMTQIYKLFSPHALSPWLQSPSSPLAIALTPHPSSVQAGLCLRLAFSLCTQTTSKRTCHKSEHRLRSVAWISEADLLVSELPDIHHKHNTAESDRLQMSLLSRGKEWFSLLSTMNGKCDQDMGDNSRKWDLMKTREPPSHYDSV